jgi:predicted transposase YdaD
MPDPPPSSLEPSGESSPLPEHSFGPLFEPLFGASFEAAHGVPSDPQVDVPGSNREPSAQSSTEPNDRISTEPNDRISTEPNDRLLPEPNDRLFHHPHDRLIRATFSEPGKARGFLESHIPEAVSSSLQWDSLRVVPGSFIDPELASCESDLVFQILRGGQDSYVYLLFEHQSGEDAFMAYRLLRYVMRLWERHRSEHPASRKLPPVFPLVLFQSAVPWKSGTGLRELIELKPGDPLESWQPEFRFNLLELLRIGYGDFRGTPEGVLALRVLKADPVNELLSDPVWEAGKWRMISADALARLMRYVCDRDLSRTALTQRIEQLKAPDLEETLMTIAEQYRAEGREAGHAAGHAAGHSRGKQEGRTEGLFLAQRKAVLRALEIRHGAVPGELVVRVQGLESEAELDRLLEAAIRSSSLEDFERQLPQ